MIFKISFLNTWPSGRPSLKVPVIDLKPRSSQGVAMTRSSLMGIMMMMMMMRSNLMDMNEFSLTQKPCWFPILARPILTCPVAWKCNHFNFNLSEQSEWSFPPLLTVTLPCPWACPARLVLRWNGGLSNRPCPHTFQYGDRSQYVDVRIWRYNDI